MLKPIDINNNNKLIYSISFCSDYSIINNYIMKDKLSDRKICIVADSNVSQYLLTPLINILEKSCNKLFSIVIPAGEEYKHTGTINDIYEKLIKEHFDRNDVLMALGGGVTGDMTGFAAATYLRGIRFIQIPTSLLAMVDSSIGGKTGVDYKGYKNMIGAFHMPSAVFVNPSVLNTLPERQFISGFAEIIKHALINDVNYFDYLRQNVEGALDHQRTDILQKIIYSSCMIKKSIVEEDATEQGIRAHLNFGHTIGHAIEKYMNFTLFHGECVALGCVAALYISYKRNLINKNDYLECRKLFKSYKLPVFLNNDFDISRIIDITKSDKKSDGNTVKFILLDKIGHAFIDKTVSDSEMSEALVELKGDYYE